MFSIEKIVEAACGCLKSLVNSRQISNKLRANCKKLSNIIKVTNKINIDEKAPFKGWGRPVRVRIKGESQ